MPLNMAVKFVIDTFNRVTQRPHQVNNLRMVDTVLMSRTLYQRDDHRTNSRNNCSQNRTHARELSDLRCRKQRLKRRDHHCRIVSEMRR